MDSKPVYLSAEALGIQPYERDGLIALIGPLSRNEIALRMGSWHTCDTIHCIAGWVAFNSGNNVQERSRHASLERLYQPPCGLGFTHKAWRASAPQAALAIINYLVTGDPQWDAVMSGAA